jgi:hypothetical protein
MTTKTVLKFSRHMRLAAGGAILGAAVAGIVAGPVGLGDRFAVDVIGATIGFGGAWLFMVRSHLD